MDINSEFLDKTGKLGGLVPGLVLCLLCLLGLLPAGAAFAEDRADTAFNGTWIISEELSDDTDKQVEKAIKEAGGKPRSKKKGKGRYKGGPPEQAMYDHISYDEVLRFQYQSPEFRLEYEEGFTRVFHSDGRRRSASASGRDRRERTDFAFASWSDDGNTLYVESRPRDGGRTSEVYKLARGADGSEQLQVELVLKSLLFSGTVRIKRVYLRQGARQPGSSR